MTLRPVAFATLFALAGCATFDGSFHATSFLREQITGDTRRACMAREYQYQARISVRAGRDWSRATRFADKGRAALANEQVPPAVLDDFTLSASQRPELETARADVTAATQSTCDCGRTQALFDGWVEWAADPTFVAPVFPDTPIKDAKTAFAEGLSACKASIRPR